MKLTLITVFTDISQKEVDYYLSTFYEDPDFPLSKKDVQSVRKGGQFSWRHRSLGPGDCFNTCKVEPL